MMTRTVPTRQRILQAARLLFWRRGYRDVSVEDICVQAQGLKGSFYHFFGSKEQLLVEVLEDIWKEERESIAAIRAMPMPMLERLHFYVDRLAAPQLQSYRDHGEILGSFYLALNSGLPPAGLAKVRQMAYAFKVSLMEMFTVMADEGLLDHASIPLKVKAFNYFLSGAHMDARILGRFDPLDGLADQMLKLLDLPPVQRRPVASLPEATTTAQHA